MIADVYWTVGRVPESDNLAGDLMDALFAGHIWQERGTLTTEHAVSSHGLPVLVREDGRVLTPEDLPADHLLHPHMRGSADVWLGGMLAGARAAGYRIDPTF